MELQYYGGNCLRINTRKAQIVVDDNLDQLGLKSITKPSDICVHTTANIPDHECKFEANMPGEYEVSGVTIRGIAARGYMDSEGQQSAVIYTLSADDTKIAILGHIHPELSDEQLEDIGLVDVAVVPVGNGGYTLDGAGALKLIKKMEPKVVIPTHYGDKGIKYEVPQVELVEAIKGLAMEPAETVDKFKPTAGELSDTTRLIVLNRQQNS